MGVLVVIALVGEVVAWITFVGGALCLLAFAFARVVDGTWEPTEAVVADGPAGPCVRWFAGGEFHERPLDEEERQHIQPGESQPAYYRRRTPDRLRFQPDSPLPRALGGLAAILLSIGLLATIASTVAGLID
ncbi:hypothetical protein [Agromyces sp. C10]|uniref:hypothetical protein n=1 Tax=Agromyces sp. C10 TaxID=2935077 RepID=UPI00200B3F3F|nr:hypothetical protein [Agromyces sp. C10]MCK8608242.1 hypothetical protein [Agromyces sp. C10]